MATIVIYIYYKLYVAADGRIFLTKILSFFFVSFLYFSLSFNIEFFDFKQNTFKMKFKINHLIRKFNHSIYNFIME